MLLFDAHLDLGFNAVEWQRDLEAPLDATRRSESHLTELGRGKGTVSFGEMRRGEVGLSVATLFARKRNDGSGFGCATHEACYAAGHAHMAYYRALERKGVLKVIETASNLASHTDRWLTNPSETPLGCLISIECTDMIPTADTVDEWYAAGVRFIGLTHYNTNRHGGGTRSEEGLFESAKPILRRMEELNIPLDMTHLSDRSFRDAANWFGGELLASHNNTRKFCDWQRQFTDEQVLTIVGRGGVIGVALDAVMLQPNWVRGTSVPEVTMERVIDNVDHICQLAGNTTQVGIGSDLDGGYGYEQTPKDLNTIADMQRLPELLSQRGYSDAAVQGFAYQNWVNYFCRVLP